MDTLSDMLTDSSKRSSLGLSADVLDTLDNLRANGTLTHAGIKKAFRGSAVLDQILNRIGENRGTTIASIPAERLIVNTYKQQGERDLTTYESSPGRRVTLEEAARIAKQRNWDTFDYDGNEYKTPTTTSTRPSSSSTPRQETPKKPTTNTVTKDRSGQGSTTRTSPAVLQPIRKSIDRSSEYQTITTQPIQKAMGGMTTPKVGQRITFEHGGRIHSGIVKYSNPYTGDFDIV